MQIARIYRAFNSIDELLLYKYEDVSLMMDKTIVLLKILNNICLPSDVEEVFDVQKFCLCNLL